MSKNQAHFSKLIIDIIVPKLQKCKEDSIQCKDMHPFKQNSIFELLFQEGPTPNSSLLESIDLLHTQQFQYCHNGK